MYYVDPPAVLSCQPNFSSEIMALCKSAKNTPGSHQTSYKSYLSEIGSAHKKFSPFELTTLGGQSLLWTEHTSSCNPKVVWGEEQCWPTCRNSLSLFPDFPHVVDNRLMYISLATTTRTFGTGFMIFALRYRFGHMITLNNIMNRCGDQFIMTWFARITQ